MAKKINAINISKLVNKTDYNAKIKDSDDKILSIINLATTAALISVKSKIRNVSTLVKKTDYDAKILDIESKYFTISDFNKICK